MVAARRAPLLALSLAAAGALAALEPAHGQDSDADVSVQASVDRSSVRENESFTYLLRAEGRVRAEPDVQPLTADFEILNRSSSQRVQIINGRTREVAEWTFQLMPKRTGELTLPPLRVGDASSNPIELEVLPAPVAGDAPADIFIEIEVEPATAYVQSQVVLSLRLFVGVPTGRATLTAPRVQGGEAIVERLGEDRRFQIARAGRNFRVSERRYAIFPQATGQLTIGPAVFEAMVIPSRGFSRVQRLRSETVELEILPAVPPPPEFAGAAWLPAERLAIEERWSDEGADFEAGVPRTRTLTVTADGLLETQLPELEVASSGGVRQYPDQPELDRRVTEEGIWAERTERYAVIAPTPGTVEIAGVELPWFNTSEARWEAARIEPRRVAVVPGAVPAASAAAGSEPAPAEPAPQALPAGPGIWPWVSALLACAWLATLGYALRGRADRGRERAARTTRASAAPRRGANRRLLRRLRAACARGDASEARQLLIEWGALRFPEAPPTTLGALAAKLPESAAAAIHGLESHLYGSREDPWSGEDLRASLAEVDAVKRAGTDAQPDPLLPLYR